ncbi:MAG: sigma factor-like helix-turn-helix DNA-binding protein, partial [Planctomycetaceae bacterium]
RLETVAAIRHLLAQLSSEQVAILTAKYLDGLSVAEIVSAMGGTIESVRSRLARARREFRERYERLTKERDVPDMSPGKGDS